LSDTHNYILAVRASSDLPNSRYLTASRGIQFNDLGGQGKFEIRLRGICSTLDELAPLTRGFVIKSDSAKVSTLNLESPNQTLDFNFPAGITGSTLEIEVNPSKTVQLINVQLNGVPMTTYSTINFVSTPSAGVVIQNDVVNQRTNIGFVATGGGGNPGTLTKTSFAFNAGDWSVSGDTAIYTIVAASHGLEEGSITQVFDGNGYLMNASIQIQNNSSNDIVFSVAAGSQFTGSAVLVGTEAA
jgi:hypothetical protein